MKYVVVRVAVVEDRDGDARDEFEEVIAIRGSREYAEETAVRVVAGIVDKEVGDYDWDVLEASAPIRDVPNELFRIVVSGRYEGHAYGRPALAVLVQEVGDAD